MNHNNKIPAAGIKDSLILFGGPSILLISETRILIPFLSRRTGWEPVIFWFIVAGLGIFLPLLIMSYLLLVNEEGGKDANVWKDRLRFKKLTRKDLIWSVISVAAVAVLSAAIMLSVQKITGESPAKPAFMDFQPLTKGRYWILLIWLPYWILNIMGEEILWRGVILPRQEVCFGKNAWIINGVFWGLFHLAFGRELLLTLIPILFILPYTVQKTRNSWSGVIIHAAVNGPSFIAISFGLLN